jgi:hypothetical protein
VKALFCYFYLSESFCTCLERQVYYFFRKVCSEVEFSFCTFVDVTVDDFAIGFAGLEKNDLRTGLSYGC